MPSPRHAQAERSPRTAKSASTTATRTPNRGGVQARPGSAAQVAQLQRQYGNRATQQMMTTREPVIQRAGGVNDQDTYKQPNNIMGVTTDPKLTKDTPKDEIQNQVTQLIRHAELASGDFKTMLTGIIDSVNAEIPGGCVNGDPSFQYVTKALDSALLKAQGRMPNESVADMKDVLRGTIRCKNVQALNKAQQLLSARATQLMQLTEITVGGTQKKDGFARRAGDMVGYGDIKFLTPVVHAVFDAAGPAGAPGRPDFWMYAEIQLMSDDMNAKKMEGGGHAFYDLTRDAKAYQSPQAGGITHYVEPNDIVVHSTQMLLGEHYDALERGVTPSRMATLVPKLLKLALRQRIELTKAEYEGLELAGELIYRRERLEGNFARQGIGAGVMRGDWTESTPVTQGWGGTPVRPRR